ncbi:MAG: GMC family oxidoreductase [Acidimicrobiia bacterium]
MTSHAVVIGSGAGGSVAAWVLAEAGWDVTILEKGRNRFRGLGDPLGIGPPRFGGDEVGANRFTPGNPRTGRTQAEAAAGVARSHVGALNNLPVTVGGGTTYWGASVPRFWDIDFRMASTYGPVPDAQVADWPFGYDDLVPYYDVVEDLIGTAGSLAATPDFVLAHMPRGEYPQPPGPPTYAARVFATGAAKLGFHTHPMPGAINSVPHDGRPACNNCGFCNAFGCPIHARGGAAVTFLHSALLAGAELRTRACVTGVRTQGGRAVAVDYLEGLGPDSVSVEADVVVLAASPIESTRIAQLSGISPENDLLGRHLCFHSSSYGAGVLDHRVHTYKGRASVDTMMDAAVPDTKSGKLFGLPYIRGGVVEIGAGQFLIDEARSYDTFPFTRGRRHKDLMRASTLRDRLVGAQMLGEDLAQAANRVDLDPRVKDIYGLPVPRITYSLHRHDRIASWYWAARIAQTCRAAGCAQAYFLPDGLGIRSDGPVSPTRHISGTMRMGADADTSVTDQFGRMHDIGNLVVCDGSVFPTSGAFNPTNTIMAVAMRSATALAHGEDQASRGPVTGIAA